VVRVVPDSLPGCAWMTTKPDFLSNFRDTTDLTPPLDTKLSFQLLSHRSWLRFATGSHLRFHTLFRTGFPPLARLGFS
jgi:hypothetical protein